MNRAIASVGVAKQTDKATIPANPDYWHGVSSGAMASVELTDEVADVTTGLGAPALAYRTEAGLPTGFSTLTFDKAVGVYLLGALGDVTTTGVSAPYTHVFEMASDTPYLAFFSELDAWRQRNGQSKIDELVFEWDGPKPLRMSVMAQGCAFSIPAEITAPIPDEMLGTFFTPVGGTFKASVSGATPAVAQVLSGKITLSRSLVVDHFSGAITPGEVSPSALSVPIELNIRVADWVAWRTIVTGATDGTTIGGLPVYGSCETVFTSGTNSLTFEAARVKMTAAPVEADPAGGPVELQLRGDCMVSGAAVSPITATLTNGVTAY